MSNTVKLEVNQKSIDLPLVKGSEGEIGVDISKLRSQTKAITLDPGFVNTGSCESGITFLDGEKGVLRYRGYPIEQLAGKSNFLEVSFLLIYGELPTNHQLQDLKKMLNGTLYCTKMYAIFMKPSLRVHIQWQFFRV